jgi:signal peptidase I
MAPTLAPGERALLLRFDRWTLRLGGSPYRVGDVVVFAPPEGDGGPPLIKRVVAVGGETVELRGGALVVEGAPRPEPYLAGGITSAIDRGPLRIPNGQLYVMGDNSRWCCGRRCSAMPRGGRWA